MLPYSPFQPEDLGPLAEVIPGPEPPLKLALSRIPVVQGTDAIIPVCEPTLRGNEERYVVECIRTNWISSAGHFVTRFEDMFREFCGTRYAIATTSGTTALQLALYTLGIGEGDEVLIPTFTMIASANTVRHCGAIPVPSRAPGTSTSPASRRRSHRAPRRSSRSTPTGTPPTWIRSSTSRAATTCS